MMWTTTGNLTNVAEQRASSTSAWRCCRRSKRRGSPTGGGNFYIFKNIDARSSATRRSSSSSGSPRRSARPSGGSTPATSPSGPAAWETPEMKKYVARVPAGRRRARPAAVRRWPELSTHDNQRVTKALNDGLQAALTGTKSAGQALKDAQREATPSCARYAEPDQRSHGPPHVRAARSSRQPARMRSTPGCCCCRRWCCSRSSRTIRRSRTLGTASTPPRAAAGRRTSSGSDNYRAADRRPGVLAGRWSTTCCTPLGTIPLLDRAGAGRWRSGSTSASPGRGFLRMAYFTPTVLPMIAAPTSGCSSTRRDTACSSRCTGLFGLPSHNWLGSPSTALAGVIVVSIWKEAGFFMIFYLAALQSIPPHLAEAAAIEGASRWHYLPPHHVLRC